MEERRDGVDIEDAKGGAMADRADGAGGAPESDGRRGRRPRRLPAARVAVAAGFFLSGVGFASWVVRIPAMQERLGMSEGVLGLVLLGVSAGALLAMPLSGGVIARFGSQRVLRVAIPVFGAAVILPSLAPTRGTLALALAVVGASGSFMNVAVNTQAAVVERRMRRPIMAGLHALFSVGGLVGAAVGGLAAGAGVELRWHLGGVGVAIAASSLLICRSLLRSEAEGAGGGPSFVMPTRAQLVLGATAFCVLFGEGAIADWSAVYLRDMTGAGPGLAAAGFAAFSLMMASGRFAGDALTLRLGPLRLVRGGAVLATAGIALAVAVPTPWAVVLGFGAVGAGLSTIFPTLLTAAGRVASASPSTSIATVSAIGYTGLLAGPPLIGFVAEWISLRGGVALIGVFSLLILVFARTLPRAPAFGRAARTAAPAGMGAGELAAATHG
jgi:MFS family permease